LLLPDPWFDSGPEPIGDAQKDAAGTPGAEAPVVIVYQPIHPLMQLVIGVVQTHAGCIHPLPALLQPPHQPFMQQQTTAAQRRVLWEIGDVVIVQPAALQKAQSVADAAPFPLQIDHAPCPGLPGRSVPQSSMAAARGRTAPRPLHLSSWPAPPRRARPPDRASARHPAPGGAAGPSPPPPAGAPGATPSPVRRWGPCGPPRGSGARVPATSACPPGRSTYRSSPPPARPPIRWPSLRSARPGCTAGANESSAAP